MKRILALVALLSMLAALAAADETELLFRAIACMDKTGDVNDYAARASVISGARLRVSDGVYSGKIKLVKANYTMIVREETDGAVSVIFEAEDTASRWSTNGNIAKKFDKAMKELFETPTREILSGEDGNKPVPRLTTGGLHLRRIGELRKSMLIEWRNRRGTIRARLEGKRDYRECLYRLTLTFWDSPQEWAAASAKPTAAPADEGDDAFWDIEEDEDEEDTQDEEDEEIEEEEEEEKEEEVDEEEDEEAEEDSEEEPDDEEEQEDDGTDDGAASDETLDVTLENGATVRVRRSVKEALDGYEAFYVSYRQALASPNGNLSSYSKLMEEYQKFTKDLETLRSELTADEHLYFLEVQKRITTTLLHQS